jgi:glycosyltransferase involved in cell wall biosynthesis
MENSLRIVILTYNEEANIADAIASVAGVADVLVVDSGSTDRTTEIAMSCGARVLHHEWRGFAVQRNYALEAASGSEWVFFLDADEQMDKQLAAELAAGFEGTSENGFYVRRRNHFLGRELRYAGRYPDWQLRLMRRGASEFEPRVVHERALIDGRSGRLRGHLIHKSESTLDDFLMKHQNYARLEAEAMMSRQRGDPAFLEGWQRIRRRFKEEVWLRLPCRGLLRVLWLLVVKQGFRDGLHGLAYAKMLAAYECQIDCYRLAERIRANARQ